MILLIGGCCNTGGGATEQAYYAVAQQFASVVLLATTSFLRIFWKEIAEAKHQGDDERVKWLYHKVSRGLYFIGAIAAGGMMPWAGEFITLLLGAAYSGGTSTLMLMFLYPVHQSMGQIGGTMMYATEQSRLYVISGLTIKIISIFAAYIMLAPKDAFIPGFGLASQGLAIKMVLLQLLSVNIVALLIARMFGWKFDWTYQVVGLGAAIFAGWIAKFLIASVINLHVIVLMLVSSIFYLLLMGLVIYMMPWIAGLERDEIDYYLSKAFRVIRFGRGN